MNTMRSRQRGMALVMVLTTLGVVSVLAMAMLSSSVLQAQISDSLPRAAQAEYLAESGIQWGIAKLRTDATSDEFIADEPGTFATRTYGPLPLRTNGQCTIKITREKDWHHFRIESTAEFKNTQGQTIARGSAQALVKAESILAFKQAAIIGGNASLINQGPWTFESLAVQGELKIQLPRQVTGSGLAWADFHSNPNYLPLARRRGPFAEAGVPMAHGAIRPHVGSGALNTYGKYVWKDGKTYEARTLPANNGAISNITLTRSDDNPGAVYRHTGDLRIGSGFRLDGTLIVVDGNVYLGGPGGLLTYTSEIDATKSWSMPGFPALVITDGDLAYTSPSPTGRLLSVRGVTWVNGQIGASGSLGSGSYIDLDGASVTRRALPATKGTIYFKHRSDCSDVFTMDKALESTVTVKEWASTAQ